MNTLLRLLQATGINAVPFLGLFVDGWTSTTAIALYWFETVAGSLLVAVRIVLHRRATNLRGHYVEVITTNRTSGSTKRKTTTFSSSFLFVTLLFSLFQGVFLALILFYVGGLDTRDLVKGIGGCAAFLVFGFLVDLRGLSSRPFAWIRRLADQTTGRVMVMQLVVMIGFGVAIFMKLPDKVLVVFIILKTLNDLSGQLPQYDPDEPPRWLVAILGQGFAEYWRNDKRAIASTHTEEEEPFTGQPVRNRSVVINTRGPSRLPP